MSTKTFFIEGREYFFENVEDIAPYIHKHFKSYADSWKLVEERVIEEEVILGDRARLVIVRHSFLLLGLLLPPLPKDEVLEFDKFFPNPPSHRVCHNQPLHDLLTSELRDDLIKTCFHQYLRASGSLHGPEYLRISITKLLYYARLEVLEEVFEDEHNLKLLIGALYSPVITRIVIGMTYIYIILERQCTSLKKFLLKNDVVRHIVNLQKLNEPEDTFGLEARQWISKYATLICEKHFGRPVIERSLYGVRDEFKNATRLFEEGKYMDALKQFLKNITTPGYGVYEMLSTRIIDSLLSYFLPSNEREGFHRAEHFLKVILSQNEVDLEKEIEFNLEPKNHKIFLKLIDASKNCLVILLLSLDKDPARQEAMEKCQHTIEDVCYMSNCVIKNKYDFCEAKCGDIKNMNGLREIIGKAMIMSDTHGLEMEANMETLLRNCCPLLDKEDDTSVNVYNYCNLMKVGQLLNIFHSISNKWGTLLKIKGVKPLLDDRKFECYTFSIIPYRHEPWFYWKIVKRCPFLVGYRRRVRLFLKNEMGIQFLKNEDHTEERYRRNEYIGFNNQEIWQSGEELDHTSYSLHVVSRQNILEDVKKILSSNPDYKYFWEFQFRHESGIGHGLTKEFYTLFSKHVQTQGIGLWIGTSTGDEGQHKHRDFIFNGLFPSPLTSLVKEETEDSKMYFTILGKMLAKSLLDLQIMDIPFNRVLLKWLLSDYYEKRYFEVDDLKCIIPLLSDFIDQLVDVIEQKKHIKSKYSQNTEMLNKTIDGLTLGRCNFGDLCLNFTLPLFPGIEMKEGGACTLLSPQNAEEYLNLMMYWFLVKGPSKILQTIKDGFQSVVPLSFLKLFYIRELESLLCSNEFQPWNMSELKKLFRNVSEFKSVEYLCEVLSSFNSEEQRMFLQFVTSYSKLPPGGFEALPKRIILEVSNIENPDRYLPSSMTCYNKLILPNYSSVEVTREKLLLAIREAENSFHREPHYIQ